MTDKDFRKVFDSKFMGQVNLTSGSLAHEPVAFSVAVSPINCAINGFVRAAAQQLENGIRIRKMTWRTF